MRFKTTPILLFMIPLLILCMCFGCADTDDDDTSKPAVGDSAPDFTLSDNSDVSRTLSSQLGSVVILEFWQTDCTDCPASMGEIQGYVNTHGSELVAWAVNYEEAKTTVTSYWNSHYSSYSITSLLDENGEVCDLYGVRLVPYAILIDKTGIIRFSDETKNLTDSLVSQYVNE